MVLPLHRHEHLQPQDRRRRNVGRRSIGIRCKTDPENRHQEKHHLQENRSALRQRQRLHRIQAPTSQEHTSIFQTRIC